MRKKQVRPPTPEPQFAERTVRKQIRGSTLLLSGKFLSLGLNFSTQLLLAHYLVPSAYGAFAYALALVEFCGSFSTLGLKTGISRFVPLFQERGQYRELAGTLFLALATILVTGSAAVVLVLGRPYPVSLFLTEENTPALLLATLVFLVPVQGIDVLLLHVFASFSKPGSIFFRKFLLGPLLKLAVVVFLVTTNSSVLTLGYGYLAASLLGLALSLGIAHSVLRQEGLWPYVRLRSCRFPARELFSFSLPALTSESIPVLVQSLTVLLAGLYHSSAEVALFSVVYPLARVNRLVLASMTLLFIPSASRLFARKDHEGIRRLYWQTSFWMAILSFPVFALTFGLAQPLTEFLYGRRYASSGSILAILAVGFYFSVLLGCNSHTLKVLGKVRLLLAIDCGALATALLLNLALIPAYGAHGAAVASTATMLFHNLLTQAGLHRALTLHLQDLPGKLFYGIVISSAALLGLVHFSGGYWLNPFLALGLFLLLLVKMRPHLEIGRMFPELARMPVLRVLLHHS